MSPDQETRERLLESAESLFAAHGFRKVTVRQICRAARANVAAVNYHFGDKLGLYREVIQKAVDAMRGTSEAARAAGEGQPAEEKLRRYIALFLHRLLQPGSGTVHRLINREINDPTPALDLLVEQGVRPRIEYLSGVVGEMMGRHPRDRRVLRCVGSIQTQFFSYLPNPIAARLGFGFERTPDEIDEAARHIAEFSIAGLRALGAGRRLSDRGASRPARPRTRRRAQRPTGSRGA